MNAPYTFWSKLTLKFKLLFLVYFLNPFLPFDICAIENFKLPEKSDEWIKLTTENFIIYSNADLEISKNIGNKLEQFRNTLLILFEDSKLNSPVPSSIFIFKDDKSFKPYIIPSLKNASALGGFFVAHKEGNYIVVNAEKERMRTIYHEYIHFYINNNYPRIPLWLDEGLAEYFSTFELEKNTAKIGLPIINHISLFKKQNFISLDELFKINNGSLFACNDEMQHLFYAQSWLLVHYLMQSNNQAMLPDFNRYLQKLKGGEASENAFIDCFPAHSDSILNQLTVYSRSLSMNYMKINSSKLNIETGFAITLLSYEQILFHLGDLLAHQENERLKDAEIHFNEAVELNPNYALGILGKGCVKLEQKKYEDACSLLEKAIALDQNNLWINYKYGISLLESKIRNQQRFSFADPNICEAAIRSRNAFQKTIQIDNSFIEAYAAFGETFIYEAESPLKEGIEALEIALMKLPNRMDVAVNLMTLYARAGDTLKVHHLFNEIIKLRADVYTISMAEERLFTVKLQQAEYFVNNNRHEEAIQLLDKLKKNHADSEMLNQIDELYKVAIRNRLVSCYNQAVTYANNQKYENSLELLTNAVDINNDPELASAAKKLYADVQYNMHIQRYNKAVNFINAKNYEPAITLLQRILEESSNEKMRGDVQNLIKYINERK